MTKLICFLALIIVFQFPLRAESKEALRVKAVSFPKVQFAEIWYPSENEGLATELPLGVRICSRKGQNAGILQITRNDKMLYSFDSKYLYAKAAFQLDDGNLATIWNTANGGDDFYQLVVLSFANGKVREVLHTRTATRPEFAFTGNVSGAKEKSYMIQRIIVSHRSDWHDVLIKKFPNTADIYTWNPRTAKYEVHSEVDWSKRML